MSLTEQAPRRALESKRWVQARWRLPNQLCTDDVAGYIARNANLSINAIMGIVGYGYLTGRMGDNAREKEYIDMARDLAWPTVRLILTH